MKFTVCILVLMVIMGCSSKTEKLSLAPQKEKQLQFCLWLFWCSEHVFEAIVGVEEVVSGYSGMKSVL
jgi:peptide-methionine (S)-S-oxide reductase